MIVQKNLFGLSAHPPNLSSGEQVELGRCGLYPLISPDSPGWPPAFFLQSCNLKVHIGLDKHLLQTLLKQFRTAKGQFAFLQVINHS